MNSRMIACIAAASLAIGTVSMVGCREEKGPFEKAGEKIDESVEKAGDKMEEAADEAEDAAD